MKITIKEKAQKMLEKKLASPQFLRVTVTAGGCAGLTYSAEIEQDMRAGDSVVFQLGDIRIVSDEKSTPYLDGLMIDFSDALIGGGLQFTNSNTKSTCGCGASFSLSAYKPIEGGKCIK
ncbi:MAG: iron-sulfur cluster assembly accessory protein [Proteobacteria bacterium]|nr:iron-sulfur cluster assembly accessory protein [Pseudomonadota bacterium]MBU1716596.1 iron-sulfur cluster assembly accessory protein [Pseudomonadota bacterium]